MQIGPKSNVLSTRSNLDQHSNQTFDYTRSNTPKCVTGYNFASLRMGNTAAFKEMRGGVRALAALCPI